MSSINQFESPRATNRRLQEDIKYVDAALSLSLRDVLDPAIKGPKRVQRSPGCAFTSTINNNGRLTIQVADTNSQNGNI